jgi:hypothetical protein
MKVILQQLKTQLLAILLLVALCQFAHSQTSRKADVIIMRDDTRLEVVIQEVDENQVKYKKMSDPDGPVFAVRKTEIASIRYGNGEVETFEAILEVPNYYAPTQPSKTNKPVVAAAITGNKFLDEIRSLPPDQLRATYKFYKSKSKSGMVMGIAGTSVGILVAGIGTGIVASATDANGNFKSYQDERRAIRGAWMMIGGFAGAVTFGTVGFVKAGKNGSKAGKIRRELLQRNEPLTFRLDPSFNPANGAAYLTLRIGF